MKTQIGNKKKTYIVPLIEQIKLDNEISLGWNLIRLLAL